MSDSRKENGDQNFKNEGAVLHGIKDIRLEALGVPEINANEVLISISSVGICGSDLKYWAYGRCGKFQVEKPMVLGHEASGIVMKTGINVHDIKRGDRVAIEPGVSCRVCSLCKSGRYNLCYGMEFCATPPVHGNLCNYFKHPADFCHKLPDSMSLDEGALVEPLAVAVYACRRGKVTTGSTVLVFGAGPVGLLTIMVARANGATNIIITDIDEKRLEIAERLGADRVIMVTTGSPEEFSGIFERETSRSPDISIECSGADFSFLASIHVWKVNRPSIGSSYIVHLEVTRPGGKVIMVGRGSMIVPTPMVLAATKEVDIIGVFRYANCYPAAIELISSGAVDVKPLITHHFDLKDTEMAFLTASTKDAEAIKVMLHP